jgi:hypothetical protein
MAISMSETTMAVATAAICAEIHVRDALGTADALVIGETSGRVAKTRDYSYPHGHARRVFDEPKCTL